MSRFLYEVRPYDVIKILETVTPETPLVELVKELLPLCSTAEFEDIHGPAALYPSDLEALYAAFKEINSPFLKAAEALGLWEKARSLLVAAMGPQAIQAAQRELLTLFSGSSNQDIQTPDGTDGATSRGPSSESLKSKKAK